MRPGQDAARWLSKKPQEARHFCPLPPPKPAHPLPLHDAQRTTKAFAASQTSVAFACLSRLFAQAAFAPRR